MFPVEDSAELPVQSTADSSAEKPTLEKSEKRMLQLDALRGVAILLVMNFHEVISSSNAGVLSPVAKRLYQVGWTGVDLFFVLSGFLIGGLLFKEVRANGGIDIRRFLIRRAFKIWPSYYLYLIYIFLILHFTNNLYKTDGTNSILPNLFNVQNYTIPPRNHTWSLAVEEHFYLILPFLLALLVGRQSGKGKELKSFPGIVAVVAAGCLLLRVATSFHHPWALNTHFMPTHLRIDSLFFGTLLAYFYHYRPDTMVVLTRYRLPLFLAGLAMLIPAVIYPFQSRLISVPGFSFLYLGYGCILLAVILTPIGVGLAGRALGSLPARIIAFIGVYSYPIYLWHIDFAQEPLRYLARRGFLSGLPDAAKWIAMMAIYIAVATAVGFIMGRLVEIPALKLRDRLFPSRTRPMAS